MSMTNMIYTLTGGSVVLLVLGILFALIPFFIAQSRKHKYKWIIFILCLFTMSGIAWIVALVWSLWPQNDAAINPITKDVTGIDTALSSDASAYEIVNATKTENLGFNGNADLSNDAYKLYLVERYKIAKNDVLSKYVCNERLFETVDDALVCANEEEQKILQEVKKRGDAERERQAKWDEEKRKSDLEWAAKAPERAAQRKKIIVVGAIAIILAVVFFVYKSFSGSKDSSTATQTLPQPAEPLRATGSYKKPQIGMKVTELGIKLDEYSSIYEYQNKYWLYGEFNKPGHPIAAIEFKCDNVKPNEEYEHFGGVSCGDTSQSVLLQHGDAYEVCWDMNDDPKKPIGIFDPASKMYWGYGAKNKLIVSMGVTSTSSYPIDEGRATKCKK